jgi:ApaG protein
MYCEVTQTTTGICVQIEVEPRFLPERSRPDVYFFSYKIRISNAGNGPVRLMRRHWMITNGQGLTEEVIGDGVVGETPVIAPQSFFEYESFCPLPTPTGNMRGWYHFIDEKGEPFEARIPLFFLRSQYVH